LGSKRFDISQTCICNPEMVELPLGPISSSGVFRVSKRIAVKQNFFKHWMLLVFLENLRQQ
jgi:hypothetical protein